MYEDLIIINLIINGQYIKYILNTLSLSIFYRYIDNMSFRLHY